MLQCMNTIAGANVNCELLCLWRVVSEHPTFKLTTHHSPLTTHD